MPFKYLIMDFLHFSDFHQKVIEKFNVNYVLDFLSHLIFQFLKFN